MSVITGLDAILETSKPWQNQRPTHKQLDWVREHCGEDELDRVIQCNISRGQLTEAIGKYIEANKRNYKHKPYRQYTPVDTSMLMGDSCGDGWDDFGGIRYIDDDDEPCHPGFGGTISHPSELHDPREKDMVFGSRLEVGFGGTDDDDWGYEPFGSEYPF